MTSSSGNKIVAIALARLKTGIHRKRATKRILCHVTENAVGVAKFKCYKFGTFKAEMLNVECL